MFDAIVEHNEPGVFGGGQTEFRPVRPELVVEVEAEASVHTFSSPLRPKVHRVRLGLGAADLDIGE